MLLQHVTGERLLFQTGEERAATREDRVMHIGAVLVAHRQLTEAIEAGQGVLDTPPATPHSRLNQGVSEIN